MNIELKDKLMTLDPRSLVLDLKKLIASERKLKSKILHYLWVVQQKRIFAELAYPSLFEFCTKHLGYTEAESQRRISASRLLGEIPEIDQKVNEGSLSLSALSMAQSLFRQEAKTDQPFSREKKTEVLAALENKSARECEKEILKYSSSSDTFLPREKIKPISDSMVQVSFSAPKEFVERLERLKVSRSHTKQSSSTFEILNSLVDAALEKLNSKLACPQSSKCRRGVSFARKVKNPTVQTQSVAPKSVLAQLREIFIKNMIHSVAMSTPLRSANVVQSIF
jgi:hypothetical protein